ncbi:MAG: STAS domain-containing protein [Gammaproteobacteria bacterium]|nr:STAS domain-containing protein [Gammaproteobacteria bacterium]
MGDDPLAWLNAGADTAKKPEKKKAATKKKTAKKARPAKEKPVKDKPKKQAKANKPEAKSEQAKTESAKASNRLELDSSLVINKASDIYEQLKSVDTSGQSIEIDASKVEAIDTAILQLIFAFALNLKEKDIKLSWYKPTEGLLNKASILGLTEQLGL